MKDFVRYGHVTSLRLIIMPHYEQRFIQRSIICLFYCDPCTSEWCLSYLHLNYLCHHMTENSFIRLIYLFIIIFAYIYSLGPWFSYSFRKMKHSIPKRVKIEWFFESEFLLKAREGGGRKRIHL